MKLCWIGTPTRDGKVHARMMNGVNALQIMAATGKSRGWSFGYDATQGSPNVPRQRNWAIAKASVRNAQVVLFIDSDIEFEPEHILDLLDRPEEVIGISHQTRPRLWTDPPNMSGRYTRPENPKYPVFDHAHDLLRARKLTTGLLLVKMSAFDKIRTAGLAEQFVANAVPKEAWPHLYDYFNDRGDDFAETLNAFGEYLAHRVNVTKPTPEMREKLRKTGLADDIARAFDGEDWDFNVRCEKAGIEMWIEPLGRLVHYEGSCGMNLNLHDFWTQHETEFRDEYVAWLYARGQRCARAAQRFRELESIAPQLGIELRAVA